MDFVTIFLLSISFLGGIAITLAYGKIKSKKSKSVF